MWFGTRDGLNRYDGISFQTFMKEKGTLGNNLVTSLHEDTEGNIWIGTDVGLYIYSPIKEKIERFLVKSTSGTVIDQTINTIKGDRKGDVWIVSRGQGIFHYEKKTGKLVHLCADASGRMRLENVGEIVFDPDNVCWVDVHDGNLYSSRDNCRTFTPLFPADGKEPFKGENIYRILPGPYNCLYVGTVMGLKEVNLTHKSMRTLLPADPADGDIFVREIVFNASDELWVGTESGIYIYNVHTGTSTHLQDVEGDPYSLSDNAVYAIYKDREEGMWIGSYFGGLNYYPRPYTYFDKVYPHPGMEGLGKHVREFCADRDGTLWIGTEDKGLFHYDPQTGQGRPFRSPAIYHNIHGLCLDGDYLWVGTFSQGLNRIDLRTQGVKHYGGTLADVFSILRTTSGDLLLGTTAGLFRYDRASDRFVHDAEVGDTFIYYLMEDKQGNLWLATYVDGVYMRNVRTGRWSHFTSHEGDAGSLPSNKVLSIFEDSNNRLWFTTQGGGFCYFDANTRHFVCYDSRKGLPGDVVYRIEEDEKGLFWISTNRGLVRFNPKTAAMKVYTVANGLLSNQFNYQSSYQDKDGNIYFGCIDGFISFRPSSFVEDDYLPPIVITDFRLFNKPVAVGVKGSPLQKSITLSDDIRLRSNQNSFSLRVSALSYQTTDNNTLMYTLEGYDKEWYAVREGGYITYANLPYGTYELKVKGFNSDGVQNPRIRTLEICILPPFYLSMWAYLVYVLLVAGAVYALIRHFKRRSALKHRREMEKFEQKKERELYVSKIDFFTNVAHEIRTPLTLIKSPLESVLAVKGLPEEVKVELEVMDQNAERLLNLTNQLLDFRKTENKGFKLNRSECNIADVIYSVYNRFTPLAKQRRIRLDMELPDTDIYAAVDREALTKILSNLFTNALKYSATYAHLSLSNDEATHSFVITMCNDGAIVPLEKREEIFRPFMQYRDGEHVIPGTGIGLALARSLAELHKGTLVMDRSIECNRFILRLPILHLPVMGTQEKEAALAETEHSNDTPAPEESREKLVTILIVEDDKDMQTFIARQLSPFYQILKADNGKEALRIIEKQAVDLLISDVMMPVMDGLQLCEEVKSTLEYSHIPIILLTAKTGLESKLEGLETGADAYIEKPFSVEYLRINVANLLSNRERLRRRYLESPFVDADTMIHSKADGLFIKKLEEYAWVHLENPDLSVDDLAAAMNMGRSTFYRKLKGILAMGPNEYLRILRLKRAAQLLKEGEFSIVDISYKVGFNTPSYFSICFKKQFGVSPKDFM